MNKPLIKEIISFMACLGVLGGIAYYTGIFNNFRWDYINIKPPKLPEYNNKELISSFNTKKGSPNVRKKYSGTRYIPAILPGHVAYTANALNVWKSIFTRGSKKVVFYVYNETGKNGYFTNRFHSYITDYTAAKLNPYYSIQAIDVNNYNGTKNISFDEKIASNMKEFNYQRQRASLYSQLSYFMEQCSKKLCIINNSTNEFIMMNHPAEAEVVSVLNKYAGW